MPSKQYSWWISVGTVLLEQKADRGRIHWLERAGPELLFDLENADEFEYVRHLYRTLRGVSSRSAMVSRSMARPDQRRTGRAMRRQRSVMICLKQLEADELAIINLPCCFGRRYDQYSRL